MSDSVMGAALAPVPSAKSDTRITVFPDRAHFEAALRSTLRHAHGPCAMLHVAVLCNHTGKASQCRRMLNLVGSTLRACMHSGEVVYLGDAEYAVLLRGVDARQAEDYARSVCNIVSGFRVMWEGELLSAEARIGGVLFTDGETDTRLLAIAEQAGYQAAVKFGCKLRLLPAAPTSAAPPSPVLETSLA